MIYHKILTRSSKVFFVDFLFVSADVFKVPNFCVTLQLAYSTLLLLWVIASLKMLLLEVEVVEIKIEVVDLDGTFPEDAVVDNGIAPVNTGKTNVRMK